MTLKNIVSFFKTKLGAASVICSVLIGLLIYTIYKEIRFKHAMKTYKLTNGVIVSTLPNRGIVILEVLYEYKGKKYNTKTAIHKDTLKVGDSVIIKVGKSNPDKYIEFVKKR